MTNRFSSCLLAACALLTDGAPPSAAQEVRSAPSIWAERILPQPLEREPFHAVRIPEWVRQTTGVGYTLSVQSAEQRARAVRAGVTISELGFVDPLYVYYDSRYLKRRNPHVAQDHVQKELAEYRRLGVRVLAVYPPTLQGEAYAAHPDWRRITTPTTEIPSVDLQQHPYGGMLCLLGPYGDFFIDVLAEIVEKFQVDAFSFDGLHYGGVCYCQHCRENFRREMQADIPAVDLNDPVFRRYQHWADRRLENLVRRLQTRLKGIKPDVALVTWTTNAGRFGHFRDIPRNMPARLNLLFDAPDQEFWLDETNRGATVIPALANAYIWACTNHRVAFSEPYLMSHGNPYGKDSFPAHEVLRRVFLTMTHGASPSLAVIQPTSLQDAAYQALEEIQRRKAWLIDKRPEPWAALLVSDNTRVFYGRSAGQMEERYLAHVCGAFRATLEEHLPTNLICDWNLSADAEGRDNELSKYRVLILPNAACLNDAQVAAVRDYVRRGGGLVATLDTSLCDDLGNARADFALADVLGASHRGPLSTAATPREALDVNFAKGLDETYWRERQQVFALRQRDDSPLWDNRLRGLLGADPVTLRAPAIAVAPTDAADVVATIAPHGNPQAPTQPAIIARRFGQGRVVFLPAAVDHGLYRYPFPYQRMLLANAIRWAAGQTPPVQVRAPMCVHSTVFRQSDARGERLLVHLFNDVNTTAFHGFPNDDVPLREETLPIHNLDVQLRGYRVKQVVQQPEGRALEVRRTGDETAFTVPRLDVHSILVVELEPSDTKP